MDDIINERCGRNRKYEEGCERGRRIASGVILKKMLSPAIKCLRRWVNTTKNGMIEDLKQLLQEKLSSFQKLQNIHARLQAKNKSLLSESEDLRQASMDGLEIANVRVIH